MNLAKIIKDRLIDTTKCKFKQAFVPKGFACVHINTFSKELAEEIADKIEGKEE